MTIKYNRFYDIELPKTPQSGSITEVQEVLKEKEEQIFERFVKFKADNEKAINKAVSYLTKQLDSDPVVLSEDLIEMLSCSYSVGQIVADTKAFMTLFNTIHHCPKQTKLTDIDRKRYTEIQTFEVSNFLDKLENIEEKLDKKMIAMQSILKFETARLLKER